VDGFDLAAQRACRMLVFEAKLSSYKPIINIDYQNHHMIPERLQDCR